MSAPDGAFSPPTAEPAIVPDGEDLEVAAMRRALGLSAGVRGRTSPNPWVGALVLAGATVLGEGATSPPGGPHAEVVALGAAGRRARGATLVVTLEPCAHQGRTPPCVDAILAAGIARVVVALSDPDPRVSGRGIETLRRAGVVVRTGVCATEAAELLAPYLVHRLLGRPFVTLKLAATLDGRVAAPDGSSRWITGEAARRDVHRLRAEADAVGVGAGTVRADDPALTVRDVPSPRQPLRVVFGRAPRTARVQPALEVTGPLRQTLAELAERGVLHLLVEGGPRLAHDLHAAGVVDRYVVYVAPALLGGSDGQSLLEGPGVGRMVDAWRGRLVDVVRLGADVRLTVEPEEPVWADWVAGRAARRDPPSEPVLPAGPLPSGPRWPSGPRYPSGPK